MTQLELCLSRKRRGLQSVASNNAEWLAWMRDEAEAIASSKGHVSTDELRGIAAYAGRPPKHPNAWGAIFRGKQWEMFGLKQSEFRTNNARRIGIWRLV